MTRLSWSNGLEVLDLEQGGELGHGIQVLAGATGFGLPPVNVQLAEGAGDGAVYRSTRVLTRDFDIPLDVSGRSPAELRSYIARMAKMLAKPLTMTQVDELGQTWTIPAVRVGGGELEIGFDARDAMQTVVTLRAFDPYWTSDQVVTVAFSAALGIPFIEDFMRLPLASSQAFGEIQVTNPGDAPAWPVWVAHGPGHTLEFVSPAGESVVWNGTLSAGQFVQIDMRKGTVTDHAGVNRYAELADAPKFWSLDPGTSTVTAAMLEYHAESGSRMSMSFRPRSWTVI